MSGTFAKKLKELREAKGLTQPALAELAGMNQYGIAKLEQGVREPSWGTVQALCKALNVPCDTFMQETAERVPPVPTRSDGTAAVRPEPPAEPLPPEPKGEGEPSGRKPKRKSPPKKGRR
jgi:transcriptional regulator with XRE-family HTH domain